MADISNVINVALIPEGESVSRDNMNVVAIMTSQQTGPLSTANRYETYTNAQSVAEAFGTDSAAYDHAVAFFGTTPNPVNFGGTLVIGYWRGAEESVAATAATLTGPQLVESTVVSQLQQIDDGSFDIDVDGATVSVSAVDFQGVTSLSDVAALLDSEVTGATVTASNLSIVITSDTTGASSELTYASDPASGTYIGNILGLSSGSGGTLVQGAAADTLSAETKEDAVTALLGEVNVKGITFIDQPTDSEAEDLAAFAQANSVLFYDVFSGSDYLDTDPSTNVVWKIKLASQTNYRCLYSASGNRKLATSYMARTHTVNFNATNSAITMQLKTLAVAAESYTQTQLDNAKTVGLDVYTTIKNVPAVLTSGANDFVDNRYNLIGFIDAVQTDAYNLLKTSGTKVPQTTSGVQQIVDTVEKTTRGFVNAGVFAPGVWTSTDSFGDLDTFKRNIEQNGFYVLAGELADQPQSDRAARKSPVIQEAVKNAGAIHSADIIINFNL
jgi:hypothetical protein